MTNSPDEIEPDLSFVSPTDERDEAALRRLIDALIAQRKKLGLTQPDIAKKLGTRTHRIAGLENGTRGQTRIAFLQRYARAVGGHLPLPVEFPDGDSETATKSAVDAGT